MDEIYVVTISYNFDTTIELHYFSSEEKAIQYIKENWKKEMASIDKCLEKLITEETYEEETDAKITWENGDNMYWSLHHFYPKDIDTALKGGKD
jgi:hypothetical protein